MPARKLSYRDTVLQFSPTVFWLGTYRDLVSVIPDELGATGNQLGPTGGGAAGLGQQLFQTSGDSAIPVPFGGPPLPHIGRGIVFNGATIVTGPDIDVLSNKCTLMAWCSWNVNGAVAQNGKAVCKHNVAPMPPCLANLDGKPYYEIGINGVYCAAQSPRPFLKDVGRFLAITYDGVRFKAFDDGLKIDDQAQAGNVATNALTWQIGALQGPANFWNGSVSHIALWTNRALSEDAISYINEAGKNRKRSKHMPDEETIESQTYAELEAVADAFGHEANEASKRAEQAAYEREQFAAGVAERDAQTQQMIADGDLPGADGWGVYSPLQLEAEAPADNVISYEDYFGSGG